MEGLQILKNRCFNMEKCKTKPNPKSVNALTALAGFNLRRGKDVAINKRIQSLFETLPAMLGVTCGEQKFSSFHLWAPLVHMCA